MRLFVHFLCAVWLVNAGLGAAERVTPVQTPPFPPSPIEQFRTWLSMGEKERAGAVAEWPEEKRRVLLQKLAEYESLPADERERRLRMLEMRWYLRPLMALAPAERSGGLALVPEYLRPFVEDRLAHWDSLEPATRREILANDDARELVTKYYLQLQQGRSKEEILQSLNAARRSELDQALRRWNSLSPAARGRTAAQLTAFYELPPREQARAMGEMSDAEREDVQRTLDAFARLTPEERRICIESFKKFARMPPSERALFLRNAARWQAMTPEERATWRKLVTKLPPFPPGTRTTPPLPPTLGKRARDVAATNQ